MFNSTFFTITAILSLVLLLATIAIQVLEMMHYEMF